VELEYSTGLIFNTEPQLVMECDLIGGADVMDFRTESVREEKSSVKKQKITDRKNWV
jgi:glutaredoxin-related protein